MSINKKVEQLEDGETCLVEREIRLVEEPRQGKSSRRVFFENDSRTYYTMAAANLYKPGDRVSCTIKASAYRDNLYMWIEDIELVQKEELPFDNRETKDGYDAGDFAHGGSPEK